MEAFITGIGWVSNKSMGYPTCIQHFDQNTTLPEIKRKEVLDHPHKPFGRMDAFSKLGFAAISFAIKDAGLKMENQKTNISLIASTMTGCLETDINFQQTLSKKLSSPAIFAYTLPSCFLGEASIYFGFTGESFVINEETPNGLMGLFIALDIIDSGESDCVLCGLNNSDLKIAQPDIKPGSLFFVIEKQALYSYGTIASISLENMVYQTDTKITDLYDLAEKCFHQKKQTLQGMTR